MVNVCTAIKEMKEESRIVGRKEGISEGQSLLIQQAIKQGSSVEQIAAVLALSVEEVNKLSRG